jgi:hypothetical protein
MLSVTYKFIMLNDVILNVVMVSVTIKSIMPIVSMLNVVLLSVLYAECQD